VVNLFFEWDHLAPGTQPTPPADNLKRHHVRMRADHASPTVWPDDKTAVVNLGFVAAEPMSR
jgi:hypothetical protein